jgi:hypothetical protein
MILLNRRQNSEYRSKTLALAGLSWRFAAKSRASARVLHRGQ